MADLTPPRPPVTWRLLLRALPPTFRERYADDMTDAFLARREDARREGAAAVARLWLRTALDLCRAGLAERRRSSLDPHHAPRRPRAGGLSRGGLMHGVWQDARFAFRLLRRQPSFTCFVALTLVIGLGANVAVFSVVNGVLLEPLPFDEPEELVAVWGRFLPESGFDFPRFELSTPEFADYRRDSRAMRGLAAYGTGTATIMGGEGEPERVVAGIVTPDLFTVLRAQPAAGRTFTDAEGRPEGAAVVILSHGFWQSRLGGAPDALGRSITVNGTTRTVVGVMPASFDFPAGVSLWAPLRIDPANPGSRGAHSWRAVGRLAEGATFEQAEAELATMMDAWKAEWPDIHTGHFLYLTPLLDDTVGTARPALILLQSATLLLLIIVCANVGSLLLARGESRAREMAIRSALGAGRRRLVRLALVDSAMLAGIGCAGGIAVAAGGVRWLRSLESVGIPRLQDVSVDWTVMGVAAATSALAALLFGLPPAWRGASARVQAVLRQDARTSTDGRARLRARATLVAAEVALAVVLVAGAGLMIRSLASLTEVDPGFEPEGLLVANVSLPAATYPEDAAVERFFADALERARGLPGVSQAAASTQVPVIRGSGVWDFEIEGEAEPGPGQPAWNAAVGIATPGYFDTLRIPVAAGRTFDERDHADAAPVVVVTEAMAAKFFAGGDPIGRRLRVAGGDGAWMTIVGVVRDIRDQGLDREPRPMYFFSNAQTPRIAGSPARGMAFLLRADADPLSLAAGLRAIVRDLDPSLPVFNVQTYPEALAASIARQRFTSTLFAIFAAIGLTLGAIGVYGVLAFAVAERTPELGIRRALGAPGGRLVRLVLVQGLVPVGAGLAAGIVLAFAGGRYLQSELFGVSATDPSTYLVVALVVAGAGLGACLAPVRRALRIDPIGAIRQ